MIPMSEHEFPSNNSLKVFPLPTGDPSTYQIQLLPNGLDVFEKLTDNGEQPVVALVEKLGTGNELMIT
jgi:hypothetical protein